MKLFSHASPIFPVSDVLKTAEYYRDVLGFSIDFMWEDPPSYVVLHRDEVGIHLSQSEKPPQVQTAPVLYLFVHDVDAVYAEFERKGARIVEPLNDTDYQMREFMIEDLNGVKFMVGKGIGS